MFVVDYSFEVEPLTRPSTGCLWVFVCNLMKRKCNTHIMSITF